MPDHLDLDTLRARNDIGRLIAEKSTLQTRLIDLRREVQDLVDEKGRRQTELADLVRQRQAELKEIQQAADATQGELTAAHQALGQAKDRHTQTVARVTAAEGVLATTQAEYERHQQQLASMDSGEGRLAQLQTSVVEAEQTLDTVLRAIETAKAERDRLAALIEEAHSDLQRRTDEATSRQEAAGREMLLAESRQAKLDTRHQEQVTAQQQIAALEASLAERDRLFQEREASLAGKESELQRRETMIHQSQQLLDRVADDHAKTHQSLQDARAEVDRHQTLADERHAAAEALEREIGVRLTAVQEAERLLDEKAAKLTARERALQATSLAMADAKARLTREATKYRLDQAGLGIPEIPGDA